MIEYWRAATQQLMAVGIEADEAKLEAEVLLRHVLGIDRTGFVLQQRSELPADAAMQLQSLLQRRLAREPLAYIIGHREFYRLDFLVDRRVLIPRPETEGLVERVIQIAADFFPEPAPLIADIGTGSGCIAVAVAVHVPRARLVATDASPDALALAQKNARRHGVGERITFLCGDLCEPLPGAVDIMVSNPPYIPTDELDNLQPEIALWEPRTALDGGPDGLDVIRRLLDQAPAYLRPGGVVLLEIGSGQGNRVAWLAQEAFPRAQVRIEHDLAGLERYVIIR